MIYLNNRYLAYIALLAGWLIVCYLIYVRGIAPQFHAAREKSWPAYSEEIPFPLAFTWASAIPLAGLGYGAYKTQFENIDSTDEVIIVRGYYFRDESDSLDLAKELGYRRIDQAMKILNLNEDRVVKEVLPQQINADVKSNPFEAIKFERIAFNDLQKISGDTLELCFPLKDSLILPDLSYNTLNEWSRKIEKKKESLTYIVGTADGTGVAESMDIAFDRAAMLKDRLMQEGWQEDKIQVSSGQRNNHIALHNRCVVIYFQ